MASKSKVEHYHRLNTKYFRDAEAMLKKGDVLQAGEKFWGAAAEIVKAVAAKEGRRLRTHNQLWDYIIDFDAKHPDLLIMEDFTVAGYLHANFYEEDLTSKTVKRLAQNVRNLVRKMQQFL